MPKAARRESGSESATRAAPYSKTKPTPAQKKSSNDAEVSDRALAPKDANAQAPAKSNSKDNVKDSSSSDPNQPECFLDIKLDGENTRSVPVYDNCATIRRMIKSLLQTNNSSEKNLMPAKLCKGGKPKPWNQTKFAEVCGTNPKSLNSFMQRKGKMGGGSNHAYYGAYVFFEKKRIWEKAKKSKSRLDVEEKFPDGIPLEDFPNKGFLVVPGESAWEIAQQYGKGVLY